MIFVNEEKKGRAEFIADLVLGDRVPIDANERERADRFAKHVKEAKVDTKNREGLVAFIYEKLGGLVRSEAEHKVAQKKKAEAKAKGKKRQVEL